MRIIRPDEMQALDALVISRGADPLRLMEQAGRTTAEQARDMLSSCLEKRVVIVSAKGKNGGDGLVAGRYLAEWGARVDIFLLDDPQALHPDTRANLDRLEEAGLTWRPYDRQALLGAMAPADLVIDAIFGIGFKGTAGGIYGECIEAVNQADKPVLAVDLPSGVEGGMGRTSGPAIRADRTVTFAYPKTGLYLFPGAALVGDLVVRDIGIPATLVDEVATSRIQAIDYTIEKEYPVRPLDAHKGQCGRVLVVAGSPGLTGAAALAARAALRGGAGVVTLAVAAGLNTIFEIKLTEVMTIPLPESPPGHLSAEALDPILEALRDYDALAVGPGLAHEESTARLVEELLAAAEKPLVLDADGLNCMEGKADRLAARRSPPGHHPSSRRVEPPDRVEQAGDTGGSYRSGHPDGGQVRLHSSIEGSAYGGGRRGGAGRHQHLRAPGHGHRGQRGRTHRLHRHLPGPGVGSLQRRLLRGLPARQGGGTGRPSRGRGGHGRGGHPFPPAPGQIDKELKSAKRKGRKDDEYYRQDHHEH